MTRISSAIEPIELCDEMLRAEHREIKRIPNEIHKKIREGKKIDCTFISGIEFSTGIQPQMKFDQHR